MKAELKGTIDGTEVHLERDLHLPRGASVTVRIEHVPGISIEEKRRIASALFGVWSAEKEIQELFNTIVEQRHASPPRPTSFPS